MALARGYAGYSIRTARPTRLQQLSKGFERVGIYMGLTWLMALFPWFSQLWWSAGYMTIFGTILNVAFVSLFAGSLASSTIGFVIGMCLHGREYRQP